MAMDIKARRKLKRGVYLCVVAVDGRTVLAVEKPGRNFYVQKECNGLEDAFSAYTRWGAEGGAA